MSPPDANNTSANSKFNKNLSTEKELLLLIFETKDAYTAISGIFVVKVIPLSSKPNFSGVYNCKAQRILLPKKGSPDPCRIFLSYFQCLDSLDYFVGTTRI